MLRLRSSVWSEHWTLNPGVEGSNPFGAITKMTIEFCPDCGFIFERITLNEKVFLTCKRCGFRKEVDNEKSMVVGEKFEKEKVGEGAVDGEDEFADYEHICKKCGHNKVRIMDMGIFDDRFYRFASNILFVATILFILGL